MFDIDIVITTLFAIESILKIIVYGYVVNGPDSYMKSPWNVIDFIIVIFSTISIMFSGLNLKFIKVVRMFRVLRPLRMISRNEGLKVIKMIYVSDCCPVSH
jgi:flagellar motor component MotA